MNRLEGNRILVTGAASGIGQAAALRLLDEGATVVGADIAADGLGMTRVRADEAATGNRLTTLEMNVGDEDSVIDGVCWAVEQLGGLDSLVNAAGILRAAHTHQTSTELWNQIIAVNLTGTFLVVREALPALLANSRSAIVNFSSTSASFAHPYMAAYAASRAEYRPSPILWHSNTPRTVCARHAWRPAASSPGSPTRPGDTFPKTLTGRCSPG